MKRAVRWESGLFCFRRWEGTLAYYTTHDIADMVMSDESRQIMERLCVAAVNNPGEWVEYE